MRCISFILCLFYLLCLLSLPAAGQTVYLTGQVRDTAGEALPFVAVHVDGYKAKALTNDSGRFTLGPLPQGKIKLHLALLGYERLDTSLYITAGHNADIAFTLKVRHENKGEVVVTGTLKETYLSQSPVHMEVYTNKFFLKNPTPSLFDALQNVNGVRPQVNCNVCATGDIHINGMEGAYTMITIDGLPIVSALSTVYGLSGIPNSMIQRIEIIKGPASTLYGSEAVGGLINVITRNPYQAPKLSVDFFSTSQWEKNLDFGLRTTAGKATGIFSGSYYHFGNRLDLNHDNFTDVTLQHRVSLFNKWSFQRKNFRQAALAVRFLNEDRFGGEMQWTKAFRGGDSIYGESIYTRRVEVMGNYQLPIDSQKLLLSYSFNLHNQNSYYGKVPFMAWQRIGFAQLTWDKRLSPRHDALFGTALRYIYHDDNSQVTQSADTLNPVNQPAITWLPGIFAQDEIQLAKQHKLLAGLRYDYNSRHGHVLSPRLNYKWITGQDQSLRLGLGNGYRVVNLFSEDHASFSGARRVVVAENLRPEKSYNANLNYTRFINLKKGFVNLDASVFYTYFTNKIVADYFTSDEEIRYQNLRGHAISRGITLNTETQFRFPLKANAGFTLMEVFQVNNTAGGKIRQDQIQAPPFSATFTLSYTWAKQGLTLDYTGNLTGPMRLPVLEGDYRPAWSPWYSIQNVQAVKNIKNGLQLYGGVKNLLNFIPKDPLMRPFDPFDKRVEIDNPKGYTFDTGYNYAPLQGIRFFAGLRYTLK